MGAVVARCSLAIDGHDTELECVRNWLDIPAGNTLDDALITAMIAAAKHKADEFLCRDFVDVLPKIHLDAVQVGDTVTINGITYTAAEAIDEDAREFAVVAGDNETTADNLAARINDPVLRGTYVRGVAGVEASASAGVVTIDWRDPENDVFDLVVSSSTSDRLAVQYTRVERDIPNEVVIWCLTWIKRHYDNRDGRVQESLPGGGSVMWSPAGVTAKGGGIGEDYTLISHLRLEPGL